MEQRFTFQGQQYEAHPQYYEQPNFVEPTQLPPNENIWTYKTEFDDFKEYPDNKGWEEFYYYYANQTGIPGPFRPRPVKMQTPAVNTNSVTALFEQTRNLKYSTENGEAPPAPFPNQGDPMTGMYNVVQDAAKENCGCGGATPFLPH